MKYVYVIEKASDGNFSAYVPDLPGCTTCGDSVEEVRDSVKDAVSLYLDSLREQNEPIPEPNSLADVVEAASERPRRRVRCSGARLPTCKPASLLRRLREDITMRSWTYYKVPALRQREGLELSLSFALFGERNPGSAWKPEGLFHVSLFCRHHGIRKNPWLVSKAPEIRRFPSRKKCETRTYIVSRDL